MFSFFLFFFFLKDTEENGGIDPTKLVLKEFMRREKEAGEERQSTLQKLIKALEKIGRKDVYKQIFPAGESDEEIQRDPGCS